MKFRELKNILSNFSLKLPEDGFYQIVDVQSNAHFRRNEDGAVTLGGEVWGTLYDLFNLTVVQMETDSIYYPNQCIIWVQR